MTPTGRCTTESRCCSLAKWAPRASLAAAALLPGTRSSPGKRPNGTWTPLPTSSLPPWIERWRPGPTWAITLGMGLSSFGPSSPLIYQHVEWVVTGTETRPIYQIELEVDQGSATQLTGTWYDVGPGSSSNFSRGTFVLNKVAGIKADMTAPVSPQTGITALTLDPSVQAAFTQAVASWTATGISGDALERLAGMRLEITDLPGSYLAAAGERIYLDRDAVGFGWYVDATPGENSEFAATSATGFRATKTSPAAGRMDLLTVLTHELGHVLGRDDLDPAIAPDDIMAEVLQPGVRRVPWPAAVDAAFLAEM